ncbi:glucosamine-6-phosphate deaminase [Nostoc parmelioides]|uniref:Glucosamine-6-phosphate deaminase n=1 Tax=Nostoc parmelioides FACHB-3921 TaxID=2692909 RepID=A0ABR8BII4_9NOSO|nr:glucosamine-6-phosphate deaminase [Nostoc parmelioides]MBD2252521.1 glucosamine-6-phosphate deaminase [Nostoc parmelioides FACHB-3921]
MVAATNFFRVDHLSVQIYESEADMAQDVAAIVRKYLQSLLEEKKTAAVLLATGNSQLKFLDALIALGGVDWSRITLFHLDEYLGITADHPASFRRYLRERVEKRVVPQQFHYIEGDTLEPLAECDRYTKLLQAQPIDLCCLGIGENGHLAFNDPSVANFQDPYSVKLVKLDPVNRQQQVNTGQFPHLDSVPQYAFTVTLPLICSAKKIFCLAPEQRKAQIVKQMLQGSISKTCPASVLRQQAQATLFLDINSANLLAA